MFAGWFHLINSKKEEGEIISFVNLISAFSIVQCSTRFAAQFTQSTVHPPLAPFSVITHNHPRAFLNWKINQDFSASFSLELKSCGCVKSDKFNSKGGWDEKGKSTSDDDGGE